MSDTSVVATFSPFHLWAQTNKKVHFLILYWCNIMNMHTKRNCENRTGKQKVWSWSFLQETCLKLSLKPVAGNTMMEEMSQILTITILSLISTFITWQILQYKTIQLIYSIFCTWMCHLHDPESKQSCRHRSSLGLRCWSKDLLSSEHYEVFSSLFAPRSGRSQQKEQCLWSSTPAVLSHLRGKAEQHVSQWPVPRLGSWLGW